MTKIGFILVPKRRYLDLHYLEKNYLYQKNMTKTEIDKHASILLLISTERCSVCTALDQRLQLWIRNSFPDLAYYKIKLEDFPMLRGELMVFSAPVILLFQNGTAVLRKAGVFSLEQTFDEINRLMIP
jgi:thioredoxin-like negative regulator of GroEL